MSRICEVTGKAGLVGNMVSHSNRKKLMKQLPNLQKKRFYIPEEDRWVTSVAPHGQSPPMAISGIPMEPRRFIHRLLRRTTMPVIHWLASRWRNPFLKVSISGMAGNS